LYKEAGAVMFLQLYLIFESALNKYFIQEQIVLSCHYSQTF